MRIKLNYRKDSGGTRRQQQQQRRIDDNKHTKNGQQDNEFNWFIAFR